MSDDKPGGDSDNKAKAGEAGTRQGAGRKARVIDGTAEDVTGKDEKPNASQDTMAGNGMAKALPVALPVAAFFAGGAVLAAVLWQAGVLSSEPTNRDMLARLDAADARIAALSRDVDRQGTELREAAQARDTLSGELEAARSAAEQGGAAVPENVASTADLNAALRLVAEIDGRLTDAEKAIDNVKGAVKPDEFAALSEELASVRTRITAAEEAMSKVGDVDRRIAAIETGIAAVGGRQQTLDSQLAAMQTTVGALGERAQTASENLKAQSERVDGVAAAMAAIDQRLAKTEARVDRPEAARRAALGIALASLAGASAESEPFAAELETVSAYVPGNENVAALEDDAKAGVPDAGQLLRKFKPLALEALKAEAAGNANGVWDTLVGNARSLVTVRRTGNIGGDGTEARLARAEVALDEGDVAAAVAEVNAIEGPAAEVMAGWLETAATRARVNALVTDLRRTLLADLAVAHGAASGEGGAGQ